MAEMEHDLNRERTTAALIVARREGRVGGRKTMTPKRLEAARTLLAAGMPMREIAPTIGVSVPTLYRHLPAPEQQVIDAEMQSRKESIT
jgi:DNA invertase Pin-like site-specific DNA recombinase